MTPPRTYTPPMRGWWRRRPAYRSYLLRECTSVVIALYALFLLAGLATLVIGPEAYQRWLRLLASPIAWPLHLLAFAAFTLHAWTWFKVLPLTVPPTSTRRYPQGLPDALLRGIALAAWGLVSLLILALVLRAAT